MEDVCNRKFQVFEKLNKNIAMIPPSIFVAPPLTRSDAARHLHMDLFGYIQIYISIIDMFLLTNCYTMCAECKFLKK